MKTNNKYLLFFSVCLIHGALLTSIGCANRGIGPQGGPKDTIPPVITKMSIPNGTCNFHGKDITIQFDEYIQLDGATDNILISPPQQRPPEIKAVGKKIEIAFQEDLRDSTTYTIDFGNLIVDNNEHNPYPDFSLSFSTGDQIDSLEIYGQLINAEDLNPISGIVVGLHEDLEDSAFLTKPFTRIGRTNEEGEFSIKNVKNGTYRLYALSDQSRDYCFQPGEGLAFCDTLITPYVTYECQTDTLYLKDTLDAEGHLIPDSVIKAEYFYYEPSNLLLRFFQEERQRLYFQRAFRKEPHYMQLFFGAPQDSLPVIHALRPEADSLAQDSTWIDFTQYSILQANPTRDTLTFWFTDSALIRTDTLRFAMTYLKSDSLYNPRSQTDTIQTIYRAPRMSEKAKEALKQKKIKAGLPLSSNAKSSFNYFDTLRISSSTPIARFNADSMHLEIKKDTTYMPVPFRVVPYDSTKLSLMILAALKPEKDYQLTLDSGAVTDIYNLSNQGNKYPLHVRSTEEYATLTVFIRPYMANAYIQLLNANDQPVKQMAADSAGIAFRNIEPGQYYMRLFIDENGDGKWTTGDWQQKRQPEQVAYFRKKMNLRANWTFEETWHWQSTPLLEQKPSAIRKDANSTKK